MNIQEIRDVYVQKDFPAVVLLTEKTVSRHLFAALAKEEKENLNPSPGMKPIRRSLKS